jgi:hypothetical protein
MFRIRCIIDASQNHLLSRHIQVPKVSVSLYASDSNVNEKGTRPSLHHACINGP